MIEKILISSSPRVGTKYEMVIDLVHPSIDYKDGFKQNEAFFKITDQEYQVVREVLQRILEIRPENYQGMITTNGFYWEFDLINDRHKMREIEGINVIDQQILDILSLLQKTFKKELGVSILTEFVR
ncbi:MAG: hypothetical protein GXY98_03295 [Erysipelothrix sp.]|nr:hypothetical protein [Erysipelothrix sp.]